MRILILGGEGTSGRRLRQDVSERHDVGVTVRRGTDVASGPGAVLPGVGVRHFEKLRDAIVTFRPVRTTSTV